MATVPEIIEELGGVTVIAHETGIPLTTVHGWKRARFVPRWRVPTLVALATKLGKPISESDFPTERPGHKDAEPIEAIAPASAEPKGSSPFPARSGGKIEQVAA